MRVRSESTAERTFNWSACSCGGPAYWRFAFCHHDATRGSGNGANQVKHLSSAVSWVRTGIPKALSALVQATKHVKNVWDALATTRKRVKALVAWVITIGLVIGVWDTSLIVTPVIFWSALSGLLFFSAVFASAETAFTMLQTNDEEVTKSKKGGSPDAKTALEIWFKKHATPSRCVQKRYDLTQRNIEKLAFETLLPFLLVVNNLVNLGGMYLIGKSLTAGERSANFSLVISAVIVVIVAEVIAKFLAYRFSAPTASWTVLVVGPLKPVLSWYTSGLVFPIEK